MPALHSMTTRRVRLLWIVLGALLLVSVLPLWLYHRQVLRLSESKLQDTERVQQSDITHSLASETLQFEQNLRQQLLSERQVLALTGWIQDVDLPPIPLRFPACFRISPKTTPTFSTSPLSINRPRVNPPAAFMPMPILSCRPRSSAHSPSASRASIPSVNPLPSAHSIAPPWSCPCRSSTKASSPECWPPSFHSISSNSAFAMPASATASSTSWIFTASIVAHPDTLDFVPGRDVTSISPVVKQFKALPAELRTTETVHFTLPGKDKRHPLEMIGTYSTIPDLALGRRRAAQPGQRARGCRRSGTQRAGPELRAGRHLRRADPRLSFRRRHHHAHPGLAASVARHQPRRIS